MSHADAALDPRPDHRRGLLDPRKVRVFSFAVISLSLLCCTVISVLAVWDFTRSDAAWRAFATVVIVACATGAFAMVNEKFGD